MEIDLQGIEKLETMQRKIFVPYENIDSVDDSADAIKVGWKVAGAGFGQNYDYGRFRTNEGYGFFAMKNKHDSFVIHLKDFKFNVIILDLQNRQEVIDEIRHRISKDPFV